MYVVYQVTRLQLSGATNWELIGLRTDQTSDALAIRHSTMPMWMAYQQHFKGTICIGNGNLTLQSLCTLYVNQAGHDKDIYLVHMTARIQQYLHYPGTDLLPIGTSLKTETLVFFIKQWILHIICVKETETNPLKEILLITLHIPKISDSKGTLNCFIDA